MSRSGPSRQDHGFATGAAGLAGMAGAAADGVGADGPGSEVGSLKRLLVLLGAWLFFHLRVTIMSGIGVALALIGIVLVICGQKKQAR